MSYYRTGKWFWAAIAVVLAVQFGCGKTAAPTYRIGLGPWVGFGPLYLAQEKSFFRDAGVNVELIVLTGLAERNSALQSHSIAALAAPVDSFVLAAGNGVPVKIVMAIDESNGGDGIVAKKKIESFRDLRGKNVAFQRGLPSEFFLRVLLQQNGMRLEDLHAVDMETAQAGGAFLANQLDAAGLWEPWLSKAVSDGGGHVLASTKQYPNLIVDTLAFTGRAVDENPEAVQKIVDAVLRAIDYWKQHPDESNGIMAPHFQVDAAKYALILSGAKFCDLDRNRAYFGVAGKGPIFEVAKKASEIWLGAKVIKSAVNPATVISTKFVGESK